MQRSGILARGQPRSDRARLAVTNARALRSTCGCARKARARGRRTWNGCACASAFGLLQGGTLISPPSQLTR